MSWYKIWISKAYKDMNNDVVKSGIEDKNMFFHLHRGVNNRESNFLTYHPIGWFPQGLVSQPLVNSKLDVSRIGIYVEVMDQVGVDGYVSSILVSFTIVPRGVLNTCLGGFY